MRALHLLEELFAGVVPGAWSRCSLSCGLDEVTEDHDAVTCAACRRGIEWDREVNERARKAAKP